MVEQAAPSAGATHPLTRPRLAVWLVLLAAAGTFALTMGSRQALGLLLSPHNTATGLGVGSISLAFAIGQLWWGITQVRQHANAEQGREGPSTSCWQ